MTYSNSAYMYLADGSEFCLDNLVDNEFKIDPLIEAISGIQRYGGHVPRSIMKDGWSVLEHSLLCYDIAGSDSPEVRLACLVHDLGEAISGDITTPTKRALSIGSELNRWQHMCQDWVYTSMGIDIVPVINRVEEVDALAARIEIAHFFNPKNGPIVPPWELYCSKYRIPRENTIARFKSILKTLWRRGA